MAASRWRRLREQSGQLILRLHAWFELAAAPRIVIDVEAAKLLDHLRSARHHLDLASVPSEPEALAPWAVALLDGFVV